MSPPFPTGQIIAAVANWQAMADEFPHLDPDTSEGRLGLLEFIADQWVAKVQEEAPHAPADQVDASVRLAFEALMPAVEFHIVDDVLWIVTPWSEGDV